MGVAGPMSSDYSRNTVVNTREWTLVVNVSMFTGIATGVVHLQDVSSADLVLFNVMYCKCAIVYAM